MKDFSAPRRWRHRALLVVAGLAGLAVTTTALPSAAITPVAPVQASAAGGSPRTHLDHLDWLSVRVTPPDQEGHTTYRLADEPAVEVQTVPVGGFALVRR
jgi:hypothetical protein